MLTSQTREANIANVALVLATVRLLAAVGKHANDWLNRDSWGWREYVHIIPVGTSEMNQT